MQRQKEANGDIQLEDSDRQTKGETYERDSEKERRREEVCACVYVYMCFKESENTFRHRQGQALPAGVSAGPSIAQILSPEFAHPTNIPIQSEVLVNI